MCMLFPDKKENIDPWESVKSTQNSFAAYRINC